MAKKRYKIEIKLKDNSGINPIFCYMGEWHIWKKYRKLKDAERALETMIKKGGIFEYRMADKKENVE